MHAASADEFAARLQNAESHILDRTTTVLTVNIGLLAMLMTSLARDADALGSIKVEVLLCRDVVGFWKVVRPLNAVDVYHVPKARVGGEHERGYNPLLLGGFGGSPPMKIL